MTDKLVIVTPPKTPSHSESPIRLRPPRRASRGDRHIGITLTFTTDEHARMHLLAKRRNVSYAHLLRSLLIEECDEVWPEGLTREQLASAEVGKHTQAAARKRYAREQEAERLRKAAEKARERVLLIEEELRRAKRRELPKAVELVLPPRPENPKAQAYLAEQREKLARAQAARAAYKPRVRSK